MNLNIVKNPIWEETKAGYFTSVAEDLNSGLLRTNLSSGQGVGLELTSPALYRSATRPASTVSSFAGLLTVRKLALSMAYRISR